MVNRSLSFENTLSTSQRNLYQPPQKLYPIVIFYPKETMTKTNQFRSRSEGPRKQRPDISSSLDISSECPTTEGSTDEEMTSTRGDDSLKELLTDISQSEQQNPSTSASLSEELLDLGLQQSNHDNLDRDIRLRLFQMEKRLSEQNINVQTSSESEIDKLGLFLSPTRSQIVNKTNKNTFQGKRNSRAKTKRLYKGVKDVDDKDYVVKNGPPHSARQRSRGKTPLSKDSEKDTNESKKQSTSNSNWNRRDRCEKLVTRKSKCGTARYEMICKPFCDGSDEAERRRLAYEAKLKEDFEKSQTYLEEYRRRKRQEEMERLLRKKEEEERFERERKERMAAAERARKAREEAEERKRRAREEDEERARRAAEEKRRQEEEARKKEEEEMRERKKREALEIELEREKRAKRLAEERARKAAEEKARKELLEKQRKEAIEKAKREEEERKQREAEERARKEAEERARMEAEARAKKEKEEKLRREALEKAKREAQERARLQAELKAKKDAEEKAKLEEAERRKKELAEKARRDRQEAEEQAAREKARLEAEERARREAEEKARKEAEEKARREAEEKARREAQERARKEAEMKARQEAIEKAKREALERARIEAELKAQKEAEEKARQEAIEKRKQELAEKAEREAAEKAAREKERQEAEERARKEAAEKARKEAEEKAKREAEEKAKREAEEKARKEAEMKARQEAIEKAKREALERARIEAEEKAKKEAEEKARQEAMEKRKRELAEQAAKEAAEKAAREKERKEAEEKAKKEAAEKARKEAEEKAKREAEEKARREAEAAAERARREEENRKALEKAKKEAEEKAKREAEEKARREEEERIRKEKAEKARQEAIERALREKAEQDAAEKALKEAQEKARKEAEAKAKKEAEEKARREAEEKRKREAEEKARREAEEKAMLERERKAAAERARIEAEEKARQEALEKMMREKAERAKKEAEEKAKREAEEKAKKEAEEKARIAAEEKARREAEEKAREEKARREAEEKAKREAAERAKREEEERKRKEAEEIERKKAEEQARREAEEKLKKEMAEKARREAEEKAAKEKAEKEAKEKAKREAEERMRREAEEKMRREAEEKAKREAAEKARKEAEEKARREAERKKQEAEEKARRDAEEKARREAEEKARREAEEKARKEAELKAKAEKALRDAKEKEAREKAKREAEEKARREAEEKARKDAEERARKEAEARAKKEAEEKARKEAEEKARILAEEKARLAAIEKAKKEAEDKARKEAEEKARREAEMRAKEEKARREAEEEIKRKAAEQARKEAEERKRKEAEEKARLAAEERAIKEAEAQAKREAEERAKREAAEKKRLEAEEKARLAAAEKAKKEAEEQAKREAAEKAKKEAEMKAKEEKARREAEERERLLAIEIAKKEAEEKKRREAEEKARLAAEEKARKEAEAKAKKEAEEKAKREAEERKRREAEENARRLAEEKARKEAERLRIEAEKKAQREAAEKKKREAAEERARLKAEERARREAEDKARREARAKVKAAAAEAARKQAEERAEARRLAREQFKKATQQLASAAAFYTTAGFYGAAKAVLTQCERIKESNEKYSYPSYSGFYYPPQAHPLYLTRENKMRTLELLSSTLGLFERQEKPKTAEVKPLRLPEKQERPKTPEVKPLRLPEKQERPKTPEVKPLDVSEKQERPKTPEVKPLDVSEKQERPKTPEVEIIEASPPEKSEESEKKEEPEPEVPKPKKKKKRKPIIEEIQIFDYTEKKELRQLFSRDDQRFGPEESGMLVKITKKEKKSLVVPKPPKKEDKKQPKKKVKAPKDRDKKQSAKFSQFSQAEVKPLTEDTGQGFWEWLLSFFRLPHAGFEGASKSTGSAEDPFKKAVALSAAAPPPSTTLPPPLPPHSPPPPSSLPPPTSLPLVEDKSPKPRTQARKSIQEIHKGYDDKVLEITPRLEKERARPLAPGVAGQIIETVEVPVEKKEHQVEVKLLADKKVDDKEEKKKSAQKTEVKEQQQSKVTGEEKGVPLPSKADKPLTVTKEVKEVRKEEAFAEQKDRKDQLKGAQKTEVKEQQQSKVTGEEKGVPLPSKADKPLTVTKEVKEVRKEEALAEQKDRKDQLKGAPKVTSPEPQKHDATEKKATLAPEQDVKDTETPVEEDKDISRAELINLHEDVAPDKEQSIPGIEGPQLTDQDQKLAPAGKVMTTKQVSPPKTKKVSTPKTKKVSPLKTKQVSKTDKSPKTPGITPTSQKGKSEKQTKSTQQKLSQAKSSPKTKALRAKKLSEIKARRKAKSLVKFNYREVGEVTRMYSGQLLSDINKDLANIFTAEKTTVSKKVPDAVSGDLQTGDSHGIKSSSRPRKARRTVADPRMIYFHDDLDYDPTEETMEGYNITKTVDSQVETQRDALSQRGDGESTKSADLKEESTSESKKEEGIGSKEIIREQSIKIFDEGTRASLSASGRKRKKSYGGKQLFKRPRYIFSCPQQTKYKPTLFRKKLTFDNILSWKMEKPVRKCQLKLSPSNLFIETCPEINTEQDLRNEIQENEAFLNKLKGKNKNSITIDSVLKVPLVSFIDHKYLSDENSLEAGINRAVKNRKKGICADDSKIEDLWKLTGQNKSRYFSEFKEVEIGEGDTNMSMNEEQSPQEPGTIILSTKATPVQSENKLAVNIKEDSKENMDDVGSPSGTKATAFSTMEGGRRSTVMTGITAVTVDSSMRRSSMEESASEESEKTPSVPKQSVVVKKKKKKLKASGQAHSSKKKKKSGKKHRKKETCFYPLKTYARPKKVKPSRIMMCRLVNNKDKDHHEDTLLVLDCPVKREIDEEHKVSDAELQLPPDQLPPEPRTPPKCSEIAAEGLHTAPERKKRLMLPLRPENCYRQSRCTHSMFTKPLTLDNILEWEMYPCVDLPKEDTRCTRLMEPCFEYGLDEKELKIEAQECDEFRKKLKGSRKGRITLDKILKHPYYQCAQADKKEKAKPKDLDKALTHVLKKKRKKCAFSFDVKGCRFKSDRGQKDAEEEDMSHSCFSYYRDKSKNSCIKENGDLSHTSKESETLKSPGLVEKQSSPLKQDQNENRRFSIPCEKDVDFGINTNTNGLFTSPTNAAEQTNQLDGGIDEVGVKSTSFVKDFTERDAIERLAAMDLKILSLPRRPSYENHTVGKSMSKDDSRKSPKKQRKGFAYTEKPIKVVKLTGSDPDMQLNEKGKGDSPSKQLTWSTTQQTKPKCSVTGRRSPKRNMFRKEMNLDNIHNWERYPKVDDKDICECNTLCYCDDEDDDSDKSVELLGEKRRVCEETLKKIKPKCSITFDSIMKSVNSPCNVKLASHKPKNLDEALTEALKDNSKCLSSYDAHWVEYLQWSSLPRSIRGNPPCIGKKNQSNSNKSVMHKNVPGKKYSRFTKAKHESKSSKQKSSPIEKRSSRGSNKKTTTQETKASGDFYENLGFLGSLPKDFVSSIVKPTNPKYLCNINRCVINEDFELLIRAPESQLSEYSDKSETLSRDSDTEYFKNADYSKVIARASDPQLSMNEYNFKILSKSNCETQRPKQVDNFEFLPHHLDTEWPEQVQTCKLLSSGSDTKWANRAESNEFLSRASDTKWPKHRDFCVSDFIVFKKGDQDISSSTLVKDNDAASVNQTQSELLTQESSYAACSSIRESACNKSNNVMPKSNKSMVDFKLQSFLQKPTKKRSRDVNTDSSDVPVNSYTQRSTKEKLKACLKIIQESEEFLESIKPRNTEGIKIDSIGQVAVASLSKKLKKTRSKFVSLEEALTKALKRKKKLASRYDVLGAKLIKQRKSSKKVTEIQGSQNGRSSKKLRERKCIAKLLNTTGNSKVQKKKKNDQMNRNTNKEIHFVKPNLKKIRRSVKTKRKAESKQKELTYKQKSDSKPTITKCKSVPTDLVEHLRLNKNGNGFFSSVSSYMRRNTEEVKKEPSLTTEQEDNSVIVGDGDIVRRMSAIARSYATVPKQVRFKTIFKPMEPVEYNRSLDVNQCRLANKKRERQVSFQPRRASMSILRNDSFRTSAEKLSKETPEQHCNFLIDEKVPMKNLFTNEMTIDNIMAWGCEPKQKKHKVKGRRILMKKCPKITNNEDLEKEAAKFEKLVKKCNQKCSITFDSVMKAPRFISYQVNKLNNSEIKTMDELLTEVIEDKERNISHYDSLWIQKQQSRQPKLNLLYEDLCFGTSINGNNKSNSHKDKSNNTGKVVTNKRNAKHKRSELSKTQEFACRKENILNPRQSASVGGSQSNNSRTDSAEKSKFYDSNAFLVEREYNSTVKDMRKFRKQVMKKGYTANSRNGEQESAILNLLKSSNSTNSLHSNASMPLRRLKPKVFTARSEPLLSYHPKAPKEYRRRIKLAVDKTPSTSRASSKYAITQPTINQSNYSNPLVTFHDYSAHGGYELSSKTSLNNSYKHIEEKKGKRHKGINKSKKGATKKKSEFSLYEKGKTAWNDKEIIAFNDETQMLKGHPDVTERHIPDVDNEIPKEETAGLTEKQLIKVNTEIEAESKVVEINKQMIQPYHLEEKEKEEDMDLFLASIKPRCKLTLDDILIKKNLVKRPQKRRKRSTNASKAKNNSKRDAILEAPNLCESDNHLYCSCPDVRREGVELEEWVEREWNYLNSLKPETNITIDKIILEPPKLKDYENYIQVDPVMPISTKQPLEDGVSYDLSKGGDILGRGEGEGGEVTGGCGPHSYKYSCYSDSCCSFSREASREFSFYHSA